MATPALYLSIFDLGGTELLIIMVAVLIFFGGEKLPDFARGLGKAIREFKKATAGIEEEFKRAMEEPPRPAIRPTVTKTDSPKPAATAIPIEAKPPAEHSDFEHGEN
ncbi:MAG TPA: twin-arginine translocase TatA/TatE family subunit [Opitutaceae bacterium]|jgi:TatA/E family protein of Tat protein translocase|nr:twin-arginine translocase TatA/TatE family subunit [Opitutaceae bacterium]